MAANPQPPLLSLGIYRTVDSLMKMEPETREATPQPIQQVKAKEETEFHEPPTKEISAIKDILEQQSFAFIAYKNKIHDKMKIQSEVMGNFKLRAGAIRDCLAQLESHLLQKASDLNRRIDLIEKTICSKPIYKQISAENTDGRITGIATSQNAVAMTTISGKLSILDRTDFHKISEQALDQKALFAPKFWKNTIFCLSSTSELLFSTPQQPLSLALEGTTNSYAFISPSSCQTDESQFHIMTGHNGIVKLHTIGLIFPEPNDGTSDSMELADSLPMLASSSKSQDLQASQNWGKTENTHFENSGNQIADSAEKAEKVSISEKSIKSSPKLGLKLVSTVKNLRGTVLQIMHDPILDALFVLTTKRIVYSISSSTSTIITNVQFDTPAMQLALTRCFIIVSIAPNTIILMLRNREKFTEVKKIEIRAGLRRFCCGVKELYILTKQQTIERRMLCNVDISDNVCEPRDSDYNEEAFIGVIEVDGYDIFLSHDNRITHWG